MASGISEVVRLLRVLQRVPLYPGYHVHRYMHAFQQCAIANLVHVHGTVCCREWRAPHRSQDPHIGRTRALKLAVVLYTGPARFFIPTERVPVALPALAGADERSIDRAIFNYYSLSLSRSLCLSLSVSVSLISGSVIKVL